MKFVKIDFPMFNQDIKVYLLNGFEDELQFLEKTGADNSALTETDNGVSFIQDGEIYIGIKYDSDKLELISIISHELIHAVNFMMDWLGVKNHAGDDETFAYCYSYALRVVLDKFKIV